MLSFLKVIRFVIYLPYLIYVILTGATLGRKPPDGRLHAASSRLQLESLF